MKLETAEALLDAVEALGFDAELYEDYVPRGWSSQETVGIVIDAPEVLIPAAAAAVADMVDCVNERTEHIDKFIEDLRNLGQDSLGKQVIIY